MTDLKPCPFCGGSVDFSINERGLHFIRCKRCQLYALFSDVAKQKEDVTTHWNRRIKHETD